MNKLLVASLIAVILFSGLTSLATGSVTYQASETPSPSVISPDVTSTQDHSLGHLLTAQEAQSYIARVGVREEGVNYNVLVGGQGTGLAPPAREEWDSLVGNAIVIDSNGPSDPGLPSSYDLSTQPYFPAVGNQGSQGSCAAWASTYYVYGYIEARNRNYTSAYLGTNSSQLMSPAWTYNRANGGSDSGSWMSNCLQVVCDWGVPSMATMPYDQSNCYNWGTPAAFREAPQHEATGLTLYNVQNQQAVDLARTKISQNLPLTFAMDANQFSSLQKDSKNNYVMTASAFDPSTSINHAQTVVGYDDNFTFSGSPDVGAFKIVNSWGTGFANRGYYWVTYAAFQEMSTNGGFGLTGISPKVGNSPSMLAVWHFNTAPTRSAGLTVGIGSQSSPLKTISPYYRSDSGHALPSFMCLDISGFKSIFDAGTTSMWLQVRNGGAGAISSFKIERYDGTYQPGAPTQTSYQSPSVPQVTPGTISINFLNYASRTANQAMDSMVTSFTSSGQARWTAVLSPSSYGGSAMQSGDVGDQASSALQTTASNLGGISFNWKVSSQINQDLLRFSVDGTVKASISGEVGWQHRSFTLSPGSHILKWEWVKDASLSSANDTAWVDKLQLVGADDAFEQNDNLSAARSLSPNGTVENLVGIDDDWYKVNLGMLDQFSVSLGFNASDGRLSLYLYDRDGTTLLDSATAGTGSGAVSCLSDGPGNRYLLVRPWTGDMASYRLVLGNVPGDFDYGSNSSLGIVSGSGSFSSVGPSTKEITVQQSTFLNGDLVIQGRVTWPSSRTVPMIYTDTWNSPQTAFWTITSNSTRGTSLFTAGVNGLQVPSTPGTYYLVFACRNESDGAHVASATSTLHGPPVWSDGNDIAAFNGSQISQARTTGRVTVGWLEASDTDQVNVPSDVLIIHVIPRDTTPPVTQANLAGTLGGGGWYVSSVAIELAASDAGMGVKEIDYRVDSGIWQVYSGPLTMSANGQHQLDYYAIDVVFNNESVQSLSFKVDTAPPSTYSMVTGPSGSGGWYRGRCNVTLTSSDLGSGIAAISYSLDGGGWMPYSSKLDVMGEGQHTVNFLATDVAGNTEVTRSAPIGIDGTAPSSTADLEGAQGVDGWFGSDVSITVHSSDATSGVAQADYSLDGGPWIPLHGALLVSSQGEHSLLFRSTDKAGNVEGEQSVSFSIDTVSPTVQASVVGLQGDNGWLVSSAQINLTAEDALSGVWSLHYRIDAGAWSTYNGNFTLSQEGAHRLEFYATDRAGVNGATGYQNLSLDLHGPESQASSSGLVGGGGWFISTVTVNLSGIDGESGVFATYYRLNEGAWIEYLDSISLPSEGRFELEAYSVDIAGNIGPQAGLEICIDLSAPRSAASLQGSSGERGWFLSSVNVTLSATDEGSGLGPAFYRLDEGPWMNYSSAFSLSAEGSHQLEYQCIDLAGNIETINSLAIRIDGGDPVTAISVDGPLGASGWFIGPTSINLTASDSLSGVNSSFYRVNGGRWQVCNGSVRLEDGSNLIDYFSIDLAGNEEGFRSQMVGVDTSAPATTVELDGTGGSMGWFTSEVVASFSAQDGVSGTSQTEISLDDGAWVNSTGPVEVVGEGLHILRFRSMDGAGNLELMKRVELSIDTAVPKTVPLIAGTEGSNGWYVSAVQVALSSQDNGSGLNCTLWRMDGGEWSKFANEIDIATGGNHSLQFRSLDRAGNLEVTRDLTIKIDLQPPSLVLEGAGRIATTSSLKLAWTASDSECLVCKVEVSLDGSPFKLLAADSRSLPLDGLADGRHTLQVKVTNEAGNEATQQIEFKVDTNPLSPSGPYGYWAIIGLLAIIVLVFCFAVYASRKKKERS